MKTIQNLLIVLKVKVFLIAEKEKVLVVTEVKKIKPEVEVKKIVKVNIPNANLQVNKIIKI